MVGPRIQPQGAWLRALADPKRRLHVELNGRMTVPARWRIASRVLPEHLFYLVTASAFDADIGDAFHVIEPGTFLWLPPGVRHVFGPRAGMKPITLFHFRFRLTEGKRDLTPIPSPVILPGAWELQPFMEAIFEEGRAELIHRDARMRNLLALVTSSAFRLSSAPDDRLLSRAQRLRLSEYVGENIAERPSSADLAELVRLSPDYFARVFRRTFGSSPRAWLMRERIRSAALRLEESEMNVSEIAYAFGYPDVYLFSRQFKQVFGMSPSAYRKRY